MSRFADAAGEIVNRHPAPALSVPELKELLTGEIPSAGLEFLDASVIQRLARETRDLRLMTGPRRRWLPPLEPTAWVVTGKSAGESGTRGRSLARRLRSTLRRVGRAVDGESALAWARWNRLLEEERELRRRLTLLGSARPTIPAPGRRHPG
jgi:hypothetical protein